MTSRVDWQSLFRQSRTSRGSGNLGELQHDVQHRGTLRRLQWLFVANLLAGVVFICLDGDSWAVRSPLFTAVGLGSSVLLLLAACIAGLVWLLVTGSALVISWAWHYLTLGGIQPYRSASGLLAVGLIILLLVCRYEKRLEPGTGMLRQVAMLLRISLAVLFVAIGLQTLCPEFMGPPFSPASAHNASIEAVAGTARAEEQDPTEAQTPQQHGPVKEEHSPLQKLARQPAPVIHLPSNTAPEQPSEEPEVPEVRYCVVSLDKTNCRAEILFPSGFAPQAKQFPICDPVALVSDPDVVAACSAAFHDTKSHASIGPLLTKGYVFRQDYRGREAGRLVVITDSGLELREPTTNPELSSRIEVAFWAGPTLVEGGHMKLAPKTEGYGDPTLLGKARRVALGTDRQGQLLLVAVHDRISLHVLAKLMLHLACVTAINLDGGPSSFLYVRDKGRGKVVAEPRRQLPYVLAFRCVD